MIQPQGVLDPGEAGAGTVEVVGCAAEVGVTAVVEGTLVVLAGTVVVVAGSEVVLVVAGTVVVVTWVVVVTPLMVVVVGSVAAVSSAWIEVTPVRTAPVAGVVSVIELGDPHDASERATAVVTRTTANILGLCSFAGIWPTLDGRVTPSRHRRRVRQKRDHQ
jgi:hypothetical protein